MANLSEVSEMLLDTSAAMARAERAIAAQPESRALVLTMSSLEKRRRDLEALFRETADALGMDVCSYRIFVDEGQPSALSIAHALEAFQTWISHVYGALKQEMPRRSWRLPADILHATSFSFGYTFPGSIGVALTLPNERRLMGESTLDESMGLAFEMAAATTPDEVAAYAERLGPVPIQAMHKWTETLVTHQLGADIRWRGEATHGTGLLIQRPEVERLKNTIEAMGDIKAESITLSGMLVGFHFEGGRGTFEMNFEGQARISGRLSENIDLSDPARIPFRYSARMTKTTRMKIATGTVEESWTLESLTPV